jgi:hypothetical protein
MENQNPASVNRAHRHFFVDDEVVIGNVSQAPLAPSTPPNPVIASFEATFMRTFGILGQPRNRSPSLVIREATVSEALREADLESRRPASRRRTPPVQNGSAPILIPQEVEDSNEMSQLDPSTPLIEIPRTWSFGKVPTDPHFSTQKRRQKYQKDHSQNRASVTGIARKKTPQVRRSSPSFQKDFPRTLHLPRIPQRQTPDSIRRLH